MCWRKFDGTKIKISIIEAVEAAIIREVKAGYRVKICIGTDSLVRHKSVQYATAIVFIREKSGAFMFIKTWHSNFVPRVKERMLTEVTHSVETAYQLCETLDSYNIEMEVHADINTDPTFESNVALNEAMGYIISMGFQFKAKPDAFASSSCADRAVS